MIHVFCSVFQQTSPEHCFFIIFVNCMLQKFFTNNKQFRQLSFFVFLERVMVTWQGYPSPLDDVASKLCKQKTVRASLFIFQAPEGSRHKCRREISIISNDHRHMYERMVINLGMSMCRCRCMSMSKWVWVWALTISSDRMPLFIILLHEQNLIDTLIAA